MADEAHHVRAQARLPTSNEVVEVYLGERSDGTVGWSTSRPDPFPTRSRAEAYLARFRQVDFEWRLVKGTERVVPLAKADLASPPRPAAGIYRAVGFKDGIERLVPVASGPCKGRILVTAA